MDAEMTATLLSVDDLHVTLGFQVVHRAVVTGRHRGRVEPLLGQPEPGAAPQGGHPFLGGLKQQGVARCEGLGGVEQLTAPADVHQRVLLGRVNAQIGGETPDSDGFG